MEGEGKEENCYYGYMAIDGNTSQGNTDRTGSDGSMSASGSAGLGFNPRRGRKF